jgi:hypothetical protein
MYNMKIEISTLSPRGPSQTRKISEYVLNEVFQALWLANWYAADQISAISEELIAQNRID